MVQDRERGLSINNNTQRRGSGLGRWNTDDRRLSKIDVWIFVDHAGQRRLVCDYGERGGCWVGLLGFDEIYWWWGNFQGFNSFFLTVYCWKAGCAWQGKPYFSITRSYDPYGNLTFDIRDLQNLVLVQLQRGYWQTIVEQNRLNFLHAARILKTRQRWRGVSRNRRNPRRLRQ